MRLESSTDIDYNSSCDIQEDDRGIQMRKISDHKCDTKPSEVGDYKSQTDKLDKLETYPLDYLNLSSPIHPNSSCFSKQLHLSELSRPEYYSNDARYDGKGSNTLERSSYHASVVNVQLSEPLSTRTTVGLLSGPKSSYVRTCQASGMCNAKFSSLNSELEEAKRQIKYLEDVLKMQEMEDEEDGSSTDADFIDLEQGTSTISQWLARDFTPG